MSVVGWSSNVVGLVLQVGVVTVRVTTKEVVSSIFEDGVSTDNEIDGGTSIVDVDGSLEASSWGHLHDQELRVG